MINELRQGVGGNRGFTIVELLIVIVVVGILAAVTVVAYNGIQDRARSTAMTAAFTSGAKFIDSFLVVNDNVSFNFGPGDSQVSACLGEVEDYPQTSQFDRGQCTKIVNDSDGSILSETVVLEDLNSQLMDVVSRAPDGSYSPESVVIVGTGFTLHSRGVTVDILHEDDYRSITVFYQTSSNRDISCPGGEIAGGFPGVSTCLKRTAL